MSARQVLSVDIGSTYTKAALLLLDGLKSRVLAQCRAPTSAHDVMESFTRVVNRLINRPEDSGLPGRLPAPVYACSSAKGGLRIAAVGIVPDLTLQAARLAACSAGGRIVACCAYRLTDSDVGLMKKAAPDIVLFTGGTDGGNEEYNRHNARQLARSGFEGIVLYAGNAKQQDEMGRLLSGMPLVITENIMPEIGRLNIEPARAAVHEIFMKRIVAGRGLAEAAALCAGPLKPTPLAVFELAGALSGAGQEWSDLVLIDPGGATTDLYSCTESYVAEDAVVLRGLKEPRLKRSVEGDLGLRISARAVFDSASEWFQGRLADSSIDGLQLEKYLEHIELVPEHLPSGDTESWFDSLLAEQCVRQAVLRHAGSLEEVYTVDGKVLVQKGKDLRRVTRVIGSGGHLASCAGPGRLKEIFIALTSESGITALVPENPCCYIDAQYIVPLAANLASLDACAAATLVLNGLREA